MTYLLIMIGVVGMLFATDGGKEWEKFQGDPTPQYALAQAEGTLQRIQWVAVPGEERFGLYRLELSDGRQCFLGRSKQGMDCPENPPETFSAEIAALKHLESAPPGPRLFRLVFADGAECVGNFGQTALSCRFGADPGAAVPELESSEAFGGSDKDARLPRFYQVRFTDQTACLLPRAKNALHCRWGP